MAAAPFCRYPPPTNGGETSTMAGFRFLHCADIHLDSPLRGLASYPGAPVAQVRSATRHALENLVRMAEEEQVDFVLVAGDLYDGDWKDFQTGLFFTHQMAKLGRAGIRVFVVMGNHDAATSITRSLPRPGNVTFFSAKKAEAVSVDGHDVVIHGQSFASRAITDNLAANYPPPRPNVFNIGLLHTALSGREGHESYAPCSLEQLINHGYQYWALGHVHAREVVHGGPHIVFPGNLQGRHIRESGAKGATLVTVNDGTVATLEHRPVDVLRWVSVVTDVSSCEDRGQVLSKARADMETAVGAAEGRTLGIRLTLVGASRAHDDLVRDIDSLREEMRAVGSDCSDAIWIEKVKVATLPLVDRSSLRARDDAIGELLDTIGSLADDPQAASLLGREIAPLLDKLPVELRASLPDPGNAATLRDCLADTEDMLLAMLTGGVS